MEQMKPSLISKAIRKTKKSRKSEGKKKEKEKKKEGYIIS
jgi:hypothetical protein